MEGCLARPKIENIPPQEELSPTDAEILTIYTIGCGEGTEVGSK